MTTTYTPDYVNRKTLAALDVADASLRRVRDELAREEHPLAGRLARAIDELDAALHCLEPRPAKARKAPRDW